MVFIGDLWTFVFVFCIATEKLAFWSETSLLYHCLWLLALFFLNKSSPGNPVARRELLPSCDKHCRPLALSHLPKTFPIWATLSLIHYLFNPPTENPGIAKYSLVREEISQYDWSNFVPKRD